MRNGIQLIHVFENEWIEKQEIVKSIILAKLGKFEKVINVDDCVLKNLDKVEYENFCLVNNMYGCINVKYRVGLFYEDELVYVIGIINECIVCNCSKLKIKVFGEFSKILSYFKINFINIDLRYFDERDFPDWIFESYEDPECYYFRKGSYVLENEKTDNYMKIWDCGSKRLKFKGVK